MTLKVAGLHPYPRRHSSESWNPVVYAIHSRASGNDNVKDWLLFPLTRVDSSAACSRRRSTTYVL